MLQHTPLADDVLHAELEVSGAERLGYVVVNALAQALQPVVERGLGREYDDWDVANVLVLLYAVHHGKAVHDGHHDVGDDEVGHLGLGNAKPALAVLSLNHGVVAAQDAHEEGPQVVVVFHHEQPYRLVATGGGSLLLRRVCAACRQLRPCVAVAYVYVVVKVVAQHLVDKLQHARGIALHHLQMAARGVGEATASEHLGHGAAYERERRAQLMANLGEEAGLHLVEVALEHGLGTEHIYVYGQVDYAAGQHQVEQPGPPCLPESGMGIDFKHGHIVHPNAVGIGAPHE